MPVYRRCSECGEKGLHDIVVEEGRWFYVCRKCGHKEEFKQVLPL